MRERLHTWRTGNAPCGASIIHHKVSSKCEQPPPGRPIALKCLLLRASSSCNLSTHHRVALHPTLGGSFRTTLAERSRECLQLIQTS